MGTEGQTMDKTTEAWARNAVQTMLVRVFVMTRSEWLRRATELAPSCTQRNASEGPGPCCR